MAGFSGKIIRKLSSFSPFTIVATFTGFLLFTVIVPVMLTSQYTEVEEEHEDKSGDKDVTKANDQIVAKKKSSRSNKRKIN